MPDKILEDLVNYSSLPKEEIVKIANQSDVALHDFAEKVGLIKNRTIFDKSPLADDACTCISLPHFLIQEQRYNKMSHEISHELPEKENLDFSSNAVFEIDVEDIYNKFDEIRTLALTIVNNHISGSFTNVNSDAAVAALNVALNTTECMADFIDADYNEDEDGNW